MKQYNRIKETPLPVFTLFGHSIEFFFKSFKGLILPIAGYYLTIFMSFGFYILVMVVFTKSNALRQVLNDPTDLDRNIPILTTQVLLPMMAIVLLSSFLDSLIRIYVNYRIENVIDGRKEKMFATMRRSFPVLLPYFGTRMLFAFLIYIPVILLVSGAIFYFVMEVAGFGLEDLMNIGSERVLIYYAIIFISILLAEIAVLILIETLLFFDIQFVQFEKTYYADALLSSLKMIAGRFWKTFFVFITMSVLILTVSTFFNLFNNILQPLLEKGSVALFGVGSTGVVLVEMVVIPVSFALGIVIAIFQEGLLLSLKTTLYFNYRAEDMNSKLKDGIDLDRSEESAESEGS